MDCLVGAARRAGNELWFAVPPHRAALCPELPRCSREHPIMAWLRSFGMPEGVELE